MESAVTAAACAALHLDKDMVQSVVSAPHTIYITGCPAADYNGLYTTDAKSPESNGGRSARVHETYVECLACVFSFSHARSLEFYHARPLVWRLCVWSEMQDGRTV